MANIELTPAQRKALDWLPEDGSWKTIPGKLSSALSSLCLLRKDLAVSQYGDFGPRGGRCIRYGLTARGIALKAQIGASNATS